MVEGTDTTTAATGAVETHAYLCTSCPLGCRLEVDAVAGDVIEVRGFSCKKGERYGEQEHTDPRRAVSTTVWLAGGPVERLPVRAAEAVPKDRVLALVEALRGLQVTAPVELGQIVATDVAGTGIDVIATRAAQAQEHLTVVS